MHSRNLGIEPEYIFKKLTTRCDVIAYNELDGVLSFKHRSFMEFMYAKFLIDKGNVTIEQNVFSFYWATIYFFCVGIKKDAYDLISSIIDLEPADESERWIKIINTANYMLAGYTTPYDIVNKGITKIVLESVSLYKDIINQSVKSVFAFLPRMQLFFLISVIFRETYSFEFFKQAIVDSALEITTNPNYEDDVKAYSLFFLNVTYNHLTEDETLDQVFAELKGQIPPDVALAVGIELKHMSGNNRVMKKIDKNVRNAIESDQKLKAEVSKWYETPISEQKLLGDTNDKD